MELFISLEGLGTVGFYSIKNSSLVLQNHKFCKFWPKFLPIIHFLQDSYKFVQESRILQKCYNVEHFLQESDNIFAKFAPHCKNSYKKCDVYFRPKIRSRAHIPFEPWIGCQLGPFLSSSHKILYPGNKTFCSATALTQCKIS